ncbi:MAG: anthranilate synthase component II [Planctomycetota bacterium]|jgi:anthranilate synthase/aminodeoxychorismate synthase-like glutamine amidotransferase
MILLIDNYDSFTHNIAQALGAQGAEIRVVRNDAFSVEEAASLKPQALVVSPGPGIPDEAGVSTELIRRLSASVPVLGVCLGHQCIAAAFGGSIGPASALVHGKTSTIHHDGAGLLAGIAGPLEATRDHSLVVREATLPPDLEVTAQTTDGEIMGIRHRRFPVEGVQFHPESILTERGERIFRNFLNFGRRS